MSEKKIVVPWKDTLERGSKNSGKSVEELDTAMKIIDTAQQEILSENLPKIQNGATLFFEGYSCGMSIRKKEAYVTNLNGQSLSVPESLDITVGPSEKIVTEYNKILGSTFNDIEVVKETNVKEKDKKEKAA